MIIWIHLAAAAAAAQAEGEEVEKDAISGRLKATDSNDERYLVLINRSAISLLALSLLDFYFDHQRGPRSISTGHGLDSAQFGRFHSIRLDSLARSTLEPMLIMMIKEELAFSSSFQSADRDRNSLLFPINNKPHEN